MVTIDLRDHAPRILAMVKAAVRKYTALHDSPRSPERYPPVSRIDLVFSLGDGQSTPWVHLHFDTKPGSEPDGDPTHPDFAALDFQAWKSAGQEAIDGRPVTVITLDGKTRLCTDGELRATIGQLLVSVLLDARDRRLLADLPRHRQCELGVEDPTTGDFGWPPYDERGDENLIE